MNPSIQRMWSKSKTRVKVWPTLRILPEVYFGRGRWFSPGIPLLQSTMVWASGEKSEHGIYFVLPSFCSDHLKRSLNSRHLGTAFGYTLRGPLAYFFVTLVSALFSLEKGQGKSLSLEPRRFLNCSNRPVKAMVVFHVKLFTCSKVMGLNPHFSPFLTRFSDCVL